MFSRILVPVDVNEPEVAHEALEDAAGMANAIYSPLRHV